MRHYMLMVLAHELPPTQTGQTGSVEPFNEQGAQRTPFLLSASRAEDLDAYVRSVAESSCDPGARRTLQILHGLGACVSGDALLMAVCDKLADHMEYDPARHELDIV